MRLSGPRLGLAGFDTGQHCLKLWIAVRCLFCGRGVTWSTKESVTCKRLEFDVQRGTESRLVTCHERPALREGRRGKKWINIKP